MSTKRLIRISYFTMLTIVGGLIKFPIPGTGIHFTMQTFFVIMSGLLLGARDGAFSQVVYILLGLIGLPVFSEGGGFMYVLKPSFGYIIGFPLGAFVCGLSKSHRRTLSVLKLFVCALLGLLTIYLVGMPYHFMILWLFFGYSAFAAVTALITMPILFVTDAVMLYLVCLIYPRLNTMIGLSNPDKIKDNGMKKKESPNTANIETKNEYEKSGRID